MGWWGKIIGGLLGYGVAKLPGAVLGVIVGHSFDKGLNQFSQPIDRDTQERLQQAFFNATFVTMGCIAKADGRVSPREIAAAEQVMQRLGLAGDMRRRAIDLFQKGKQPEYDWKRDLREFSSLCRRQRSLKQMFLEIQIQAALADGAPHEAERKVLAEIASLLGYSSTILNQLIQMVLAQQYFYQQQASGQQSGAGPHNDSETSLNSAYRVLGVAESASDQDVKRAYRKLMSQHHPDKLVAKGLPEQMLKVATEKTQEIKNAYEIVKRARGIS